MVSLELGARDVGGIRLNGGMTEALEAFSPATRAWFTESFSRAHGRAAGRVAGDRARRSLARGRAHRLGQDARRIPVGDRPVAPCGCRCGDGRNEGRLPLAAEGARRRRRTQPPRPPRGHRPHRGSARHRGARGLGRGPVGRHAARRAAQAGHAPARDPHHDSRVALPHAHVGGARDPARRRDGHRRRDPRARGHEAGLAPRTVARAARRTDGATGAAHRAVGDRAPARRGGPVPVRRAPGVDRGAAVGQEVRPAGHGAGRRPVRPRR